MRRPRLKNQRSKLPRLVRSRGLEPPRVAPLAPQASASTNSATTACGVSAPQNGAGCADVTVRLLADKTRPAPVPSGSVGGAQQELLDLDGDAVAADDHGPLRHRHVIDENADFVFLGGVELDDRAAAEPQRLVDRHR